MATAGRTASKKTTGKKSTSKKPATSAKKAVRQADSKKAASRKAADKTPTVQQTIDSASLQKVDPDYRRRMIAETSYFIAERHGFINNSPVDDWLEAEVLVDRLIAGTAKAHDLTLVTRNVDDYFGIDIAITNPWKKK